MGTNAYSIGSIGAQENTENGAKPPSQAKPSQAKPSQAKPSQAKPSQAKLINLSPNGTFLQDVLISNAHGKITEKAFFDAPEIIINIQDLHCNPEIQRNIAALIEEIDDKYGLSAVYAEGGYGNVNTGWIESVEDKNDRKELLDVLLNSGRITGAEYYSALNNKYDIIKGIEDEKVHKQNIVRLNEILSRQERYEKKLKALEEELVLIQAKYLGHRNKRFDKITKEYKAGKISMDKYYALLKKYCENIKEIDMRKYPNISAYVKMGGFEKKTDYKKVQKQLKIFINILKEKLPYSVYSELLAKTDNFANSGDLCFYAGEIAEKYGIEISRTLPDLDLFFKNARLQKAINAHELPEEENNLSQEIRIAFSDDIDEIEAAFLSYFYGYFKNYLTNSLTAEDYKYFVRKFEDFKYLWDKYNYENSLEELREDFKILDEYYRVNDERDEIFLRQLRIKDKGEGVLLNLSHMEIQDKLKNSKVVVVVTGGFHSEGFKEMLKGRGVSSITVMPNLNGVGNSQKIYEKLVKAQAGKISIIGSSATATPHPQASSFAGEGEKAQAVFSSPLAGEDARRAGEGLPFLKDSSALALTLGSTDAKISYADGRYIVNINGEILEIYKNEITNKFEIKDFPEQAAVENSVRALQITENVKESVLSNIERIRTLSSPAGSAELIYWLVKEISKSGPLSSVMQSGDGLIWRIASNPEVQKAIKENEGFTLNEISMLPDGVQMIISNHAVLKDKFKDNPVISAVLNVPEFKTILSMLSDKFKIQNYLTPTLNTVKGYFDALVSAATVRTKIKAEDVKGYGKYGVEVINYYKQRHDLLQAVYALDADLYKKSYESMLKSAQIVKTAFLNKELDLQLLMEVFTRDGTLKEYAMQLLTEPGNSAIGPWYEIISSAGEEFDDKYNGWIREAVDTLISAFPANQRPNAEKVRDEMIRNTKPHSFSSMIWSPEEARKIFSEMSPMQYQQIVSIFSRQLNYSSDFEKYGNHGYTIPKTGVVHMHAIENEELFKSVYIHELIHALANKKIIDIPMQIEILTQSVSALLYYSTNIPKEENEKKEYSVFELGEKNADKIKGELNSNTLDPFIFNLISENWQLLGYKSVEDALKFLNLVESGNNLAVEMYERLKGTVAAGIIWGRNKHIRDEKERKKKSLSDALEWADKVLAKETSKVPKFFPDMEKRERIVKEIEELFRSMTGNEKFELKERKKTSENEESGELFSISEDGNTIYYDPLLLDYPDEDAAKALFLEQISVVRFSKPVKVEKGYDNSRFYLLMSTLELIRTRKDNFKGKVNEDLIKVLYPNPDSESAKRTMQDKSLFAQYIEGLLFVARTGRKEDPRIENALVKKALRETSDAVKRISGLGVIGDKIPQEVYETAKTEIWPKLAEIIKESEEYLKKRKMEELAREKARREQIQKNIEQMLENLRKQKESGQKQTGQQQPTEEQIREMKEMLENMNEDQKREFEESMKELMRDEMDSMLQQQSGGYAQNGKQASSNEKQGEQYDKMQGQASSAQGKAGKLGQTQQEIAQTIEQMRQELEKLEKSARDIESKSGSGGDMSQDTSRLEELSQQLQTQAEELGQEMSDVRNGTQKLKQQGNQLDGERESAKGTQAASDDLYQKGKDLDKGVKEFEEKMKELQEKIQRLQELLKENKNVPSQRDQAEKVEKGAQDLEGNVSEIDRLNKGVGDSLQSLQQQLEEYKKDIEELKKQIGQGKDGSESGKEQPSSSPKQGQNEQASEKSSQSSSQDGQSGQKKPSKQPSQKVKQAANPFKKFGSQGKSNSGKGGGKAKVKDRSAEIKHPDLSQTELNEMYKLLEPFREGAKELADEIKREMQKPIPGEYLAGMESGELSDDFSRLADGKIFQKMLVKSSGEHRVMIVIDGSGSMGSVDVASDGKLIDNGSDMYGTLKMLITVLLALKEIDGIEIGVTMYGDIANFLEITKSKDITDESIYSMVKELKDGSNSGTEDIPSLRAAVEKISEDGSGIFKSILHISDGDRGNIIPYNVEKFYRENAESGVKFVSYGIGKNAANLEERYTPSGEISALYPQGLAPAAKTVAKAEDLLGEMAAFVKDMFKEERDETMTFGKNIKKVLKETLKAIPSVTTGYVVEKFIEFIKEDGYFRIDPKDPSQIEKIINLSLDETQSHIAMNFSVKYVQKLIKFLFEGRYEHWILSDADTDKKYGKFLPSAEVREKDGYIIKVSKAPLDLTAPGEDNYVFATINLDEKTGKKEIIIHQSVLEWIKNNGPPQGYEAETFIEKQLIPHELEEYEFIQRRAGGDTQWLEQKYGSDALRESSQPHEIFHELTADKYEPLFEVGDAIAKGDDLSGNITHWGYVTRNGKKYLKIKSDGQKKPVEIAVDNRADSKKAENRVKLYTKENGEWKEFIAGEIDTIPDLIGYRVGDSGRINAYKFTAGNRDLLKRMLTTYSKPGSDARNSNIWLEGQKGSGKNALSFVFAGLTGMPMRFVSLHANTTQKDISERIILMQGKQEIELELAVSSPLAGEDARRAGEGLPLKIKVEIPAVITKHEFSEIYKAALQGELVIIDEVDKVKLEGVLSALNTILTRERISGLSYDDNFRVIMLSNDRSGKDVSGNDLNRKNRDLLSRMTKIKVGYPEFGEEYERIMDGIYGDLEDGSENKEILSDIVSFLITLAGWSRNYNGKTVEFDGKQITFPKLSKSISPRTIIKIAKHIHPDNYMDDIEYLGSLIDSAFATDALSDKEREKFNEFLSQFANFKRFNQNAKFALGYKKLEDAEFEYKEENGAVYAVLGKGKWEVKVKTAINPENIKEARERLKSRPQYQLPANMLLFWQWMKDINLGENIMVLGVPGTGKTVLTDYLLNTVLGLDAQSMQLNVQSSGTDLLGQPELENGINVFRESPLVRAMIEGKPVIIDEADKPRDETALAVLNNILQDGFVTLPDGRVIYAEEGFFAISAGNLPGKGGTASTRISGEVMDRHSVYIMEPLPKEQTIEMLKRYAKANGYEMSEGFIEKLTEFHYEIMNDKTIKQKPSIRTLEKTIGTLARDPSRFSDVSGVYMEGFSVSNEKIKKMVLSKDTIYFGLPKDLDVLSLSYDEIKRFTGTFMTSNDGSTLFYKEDNGYKFLMTEGRVAAFDYGMMVHVACILNVIEMSGYQDKTIQEIRNGFLELYDNIYYNNKSLGNIERAALPVFKNMVNLLTAFKTYQGLYRDKIENYLKHNYQMNRNQAGIPASSSEETPSYAYNKRDIRRFEDLFAGKLRYNENEELVQLVKISNSILANLNSIGNEWFNVRYINTKGVMKIDVDRKRFKEEIGDFIEDFLNKIEREGYPNIGRIDAIRNNLGELASFSKNEKVTRRDYEDLRSAILGTFNSTIKKAIKYNTGTISSDFIELVQNLVSDTNALLKDIETYPEVGISYDEIMEDIDEFNSWLDNVSGYTINPIMRNEQPILPRTFYREIIKPAEYFLKTIEMSGYRGEIIKGIRDGLQELTQKNKEGAFNNYNANTAVPVDYIPAIRNMRDLSRDFSRYARNNKEEIEKQKYNQQTNRNQTNVSLQYSYKEGKKYLDIGGVSAPIDDRKDDPRRVKLFLSGEDNAKEVFPRDLTEIPEIIYYQIGDGEKTAFVFTDGNKELLKRMIATYGKPETDARNTNLWLEGQKGSGKNSLAFIFAGLTGVPMRFVSLHANTTQKDISERTVLSKAYKKVITKTPDGREIEIDIPANITIKQFSEIYEAAKNGELVIIDEADKVKLDGVLSALNTVLTRDNIKGLTYDPRFRVIALSNSHETKDVSGKDLNEKARDFISRLTKIEVPYPSKEEEMQRVIKSVFGSLEKDSKEYQIIDSVINIAEKIRNNKNISRPLSPRSVLRIAKHIKAFPKDTYPLTSLIDRFYGVGTLPENEHIQFEVMGDTFSFPNIRSKMGYMGSGSSVADKMGYDDYKTEIKFEYTVDDKGVVYVNLGKDDRKVTVPTKYKSIKEARANLKDQYHLPVNMILFWQWMQDISLGDNIMVLGVPGTGKTVLTNYLLNNVLGYGADMQTLSVQTEGRDLLGEWSLQNGEQVFSESLIVKAMIDGKPVIIDEVDKPRDETALAALNNILEAGFVTLPDGRVIHAKKGFLIVSAGNLANKGGTASTRISGEVMDRHAIYVLDPLPEKDTIEMLKRYAKANGYEMPEGFIEKLAEFHYEIMEDKDIKQKPSMRTLEKTIGTLARDPSRFNGVTGVYLEGYSVSNKKIEERILKYLFPEPLPLAYNKYMQDLSEFRDYYDRKNLNLMYRSGPRTLTNAGSIVKNGKLEPEIFNDKVIVPIDSFLKIIEMCGYHDERIQQIRDGLQELLKKEYAADRTGEYLHDFKKAALPVLKNMASLDSDFSFYAIEKKAESINQKNQKTKNYVPLDDEFVKEWKKEYAKNMKNGNSSYLSFPLSGGYTTIYIGSKQNYREFYDGIYEFLIRQGLLKIGRKNEGYSALAQENPFVEKAFIDEIIKDIDTVNEFGLGRRFKNEESAKYKKLYEDLFIKIGNNVETLIYKLENIKVNEDVHISYKSENGKKYLDINGVSAPVDSRKGIEKDPRRVKLFLSGEDNAKEVFPQDLKEIPETIYYQIGSGEKTAFVFTFGNKELLKRMIATYGKPESDARNTNLWLEGETGSGKNALAFVFAGLTGIPMRFVSLHANTTQRDISERTVIDTIEQEVWVALSGGKKVKAKIPAMVTKKQFSEIYEAAQNGELVIIDEVDKVKLDGVLSALNTVLTRDKISGLKYDPRFRVIALSNDHKTGDVSGKDLNLKARDFISRFAKIEVQYPTKEEEIQRVMKSVFGDLSSKSLEYKAARMTVDDIVTAAVTIRNDKVLTRPLSPRSVLKIAKHLKAFPKDKEYLRSLIKQSYGAETLSSNEQKKFEKILENILGTKGYKEYPKDFQMEYGKAEGIDEKYIQKAKDLLMGYNNREARDFITGKGKGKKKYGLASMDENRRVEFAVHEDDGNDGRILDFVDVGDILEILEDTETQINNLVNKEQEWKDNGWKDDDIGEIRKMMGSLSGLAREYKDEKSKNETDKDQIFKNVINNDFEYIKSSDPRAVIAGSDPQSDIVYVSLGKGEYKVTIPTKFKNIEEAKARLKDQYHLPANMLLFWQWMKDIYLGNNIMLLGVPGTGKTVLTSYLLNDVLGMETDLMQMNVQSSGTDLFGEWGMENGKMVFKDSLVVKAMREGKPVIIDEVDKPRDETALAALNNILESGFVTLPDGRVIYAKKGFFIASLGNLANKGGTASSRISGEVMNRHSVYILDGLPQDQTAQMLKKYAKNNNYKVSDDFIKALAAFHERVANEPSLPHKPNMRTLEKTIGALAQDPSRYFNIAEVYLEGFSLGEPGQELRVYQMAAEKVNNEPSFDEVSKKYVLLSENINLNEKLLDKLNKFREEFDASEKHRPFTDIEFLGLLKQVSKNSGDVLGVYDYAVKTLQLQESDAEALIDIEKLCFESFLDEILKYEVKNKSDMKKIKVLEETGVFSTIYNLERLRLHQSFLEFYNPKNVNLLKKITKFAHLPPYGLLRQVLTDGNVLDMYYYFRERYRDSPKQFKEQIEREYFEIFLDEIIEYEFKNRRDIKKIKSLAKDVVNDLESFKKFKAILGTPAFTKIEKVYNKHSKILKSKLDIDNFGKFYDTIAPYYDSKSGKILWPLDEFMEFLHRQLSGYAGLPSDIDGFLEDVKKIIDFGDIRSAVTRNIKEVSESESHRNKGEFYDGNYSYYRFDKEQLSILTRIYENLLKNNEFKLLYRRDLMEEVMDLVYEGHIALAYEFIIRFHYHESASLQDTILNFSEREKRAQMLGLSKHLSDEEFIFHIIKKYTRNASLVAGMNFMNHESLIGVDLDKIIYATDIKLFKEDISNFFQDIVKINKYSNYVYLDVNGKYSDRNITETPAFTDDRDIWTMFAEGFKMYREYAGHEKYEELILPAGAGISEKIRIYKHGAYYTDLNKIITRVDGKAVWGKVSNGKVVLWSDADSARVKEEIMSMLSGSGKIKPSRELQRKLKDLFKSAGKKVDLKNMFPQNAVNIAAQRGFDIPADPLLNLNKTTEICERQIDIKLISAMMHSS